jgi:S1-C subfamily serine protease
MKWLSALAALAVVLASPAFAKADPNADIDIVIKAEAVPTPYFIDLALTHLVSCDVPDGRYLGTATSISAADLVTAYHVIAAGKCSVEGVPVTVVYADRARDFAVVRLPEGVRAGRRAPISCAGYREGDDYFALGYAQGTVFAEDLLTGTGDALSAKKRPWAMLRGKGYHGQSGGPIYDRDGRMVGIVNAGPDDGTPWTFSLPLSETYLCAVSAASVDSAAAVR